MQPNRAAFLCLVATTALLSGCVEAGPSATPTPTVSDAATPTASAATGSITGVVVDQELKPIPGVDVVILQTRATTSTDTGGAYTFNDVEPAEYGVAFASPGYQEAGKKVVVAAGEVSHVNVTMVPLVIKETYQFTLPRSSFVKFGQWTVNHVQQTVNQSALNEQLCSDCWHVLVLEKGITAAQTEVAWLASVTNPVTNQKVGIGISKSWGDGQLTSYFLMFDATNGIKVVWAADDITEVKVGAKIRVNVQGPGVGSPGIVFQQKVDVYNTFAVGQDIDGAFSALPPK
ncbi:MAG TPA: carboxypeptidase-like regulatory domain-containing protein [Candidatus Thermoplasmatota archaeon]|nr:carboxypeptidase-like regulatory domain-containing protein [Candidatus Thermoplasmatota archaeon]